MSNEVLPDEEGSEKRAPWRFVLDQIFGYDLFISYAWSDGATYANALKQQLKAEDFEVFLDRNDFGAGTNWTIAGRWALRRTGQLILIGTTAAKSSPPVLTELRIFSRTGRRIIPIEFNGSLSIDAAHAFATYLPATVIRIREPIAALSEGPSAETVSTIKNTFDLVRQDKKRTRVFAAAAALFLFVAVVAGWQAVQAIAARDAVLQRQSRLLAEKAESLAASGDGTTAMLVAMEAAFPNGSKKTLTAEAFAALHSGLYARREIGVVVSAENPITSLAKSTKNIFAVGSSAGSIYVFDRNGILERFPITHGNRIRHLNFSPDGSRILSVSDGAGAQQWEVATGKNVGVPMMGDRPLEKATYDREGLQIVTSGQDTYVTLWKPDGSSIKLDGHKERVNDVTFSPDNKLLVTASDDKTARIWNVYDGALLKELSGHNHKVVSTSFDITGRRVATASWDHTARVWNVETGKSSALLEHGDRVYGASFSPDGERLLTFSEDATARLWDVRETGILIERLPHDDWVLSAGFSSDGREIVTTSRDSNVRLWDGINGGAKGQFAAARSREKQLVAALDDFGTYIVTGSSDGTARVWQAAGGAEIKVLRPHQYNVLSAAFSGRGLFVVTGDQSGQVRLWNSETTSEIAQRKVAARDVWSVSFNPQNDAIVVGSHAGVHLWKDPHNPASIPEAIWTSSVIRSANFNRDGSKLVAGGYDGFAYIWDAADGSGKPVRVSEKHPSWIQSAHFDSASTHVITAGRDGKIRLWRLTDNKVAVELSLPEIEGRFEASKRVFSAHFSSDDKRVVSAHEDGSVWIWESKADGFAGRQLTESKKPIWQASFSSDNSMIAIASFDKLARVFDASTSRLIATLAGHTKEVRSASFNREGTKIITTSNDGTARVWPVFKSPEAVLEHVATTVPRCLTVGERTELGLEPSLPRWCITGYGLEGECDQTKWKTKWPYRSEIAKHAC